MKVCAPDEIVHRNFNIVFINALRQFWHTTRFFQCIGAPKKQNLFLYLDGCRITYTDRNNHTYAAESGDIVYTPVGSEYRVQVSDLRDADAGTVGINFLLFDEEGEGIILADSIRIFRHAQNPYAASLFYQVLGEDMSRPLIRKRILLMEILCSLTPHAVKKTVPASIADAVQYLAEHIEENPSVADLASLCHISEVYFRKQFKTYMGMTPREYRNSLRLDRARSYLEYGEISVQEISDTLGYATVSHFIKEFREKFGISPLQYRKSILNPCLGGEEK